VDATTATPSGSPSSTVASTANVDLSHQRGVCADKRRQAGGQSSGAAVTLDSACDESDEDPAQQCSHQWKRRQCARS
jgi:hypothetical protein